MFPDCSHAMAADKFPIIDEISKFFEQTNASEDEASIASPAPIPSTTCFAKVSNGKNSLGCTPFFEGHNSFISKF